MHTSANWHLLQSTIDVSSAAQRAMGTWRRLHPPTRRGCQRHRAGGGRQRRSMPQHAQEYYACRWDTQRNCRAKRREKC